MNEKLTSAKKDFENETERTLLLKSTLKKIKIDLHNMSANLQDPNKLKINVKVRYLYIIMAAKVQVMPTNMLQV